MMADGREKSEWARTSSLMALTANMHRDRRRRKAFKPQDFNPMVKKSQPTGTIDDLTAFLKAKGKGK